MDIYHGMRLLGINPAIISELVPDRNYAPKIPCTPENGYDVREE
jgi:hypothetical protein